MPIEDLKVKPEILSPKPPSIASDEEFAAGTSTTASPTVKQAKEKLVTTNTTQTITGAKVFTATLLKKSTVIDATTQPEKYTANNAFAFKDKNDITMGFLENAQLPDGTINTAIHARNKDGYQPHISVLVPPSGTTGAYATAPSTPANPDNSVIVTADYLKNNYVTLNTNQTIAGVKTYTSTQSKKSTIADISTTPDGYQVNEVIRAYDKNNNVMGIYHTSVVPAALGIYSDTGEVRCAMDVVNKDGYQGGIRVNVPVEGKSGAYAACPSYDENKSPDHAIVTKNKIANMVTTNTAQTITAQKNFNDSAQLVLLDSAARRLAFKSTVYNINAPVASQYYGVLDFRDKNDYQVGRIDLYTPNTTDQTARIGCQNAAGNWSFLQVGWKNGAAYATAPTPSVATNNTQIATTAYVNAKLQVVSALPANPDPNVFYFIPG